MSDIVERLRRIGSERQRTTAHDNPQHYLHVVAKISNADGLLMIEAADRIAQLEAAMLEAADELDAYYRAEYPGDHPYSQKKLAEAMASNPARAALREERT